MAELGEGRALAVAVLGCDQHRLLLVLGDQEREHLLPLAELHSAHAARRAPHRAHVLLVEPGRLAGVGDEDDVVAAAGDLGADQEVTLVEDDGDDAGLARVGEVGQGRLLDRALGSGHEHVAVVGKFLDRQDGVDLLALLEREEIDDRLAAALPPALRRFVHLEPVHAAAVGEAQDVVVRVGDEQVVDEIVFLDLRRLLAAAAAPLRAVVGERLRLDVAGMRQRHHHVGRRDEILDAEVLRVQDDLGTALVAELRADRGEFLADDLGDALGARQDVHQVGDGFQQIGEVGNDLVALETGQALQPELEDRLRLRFGELVAARRQAVLDGEPFRTRRVERRALEHLRHRRRGPQLAHQSTPRVCRRRRGLDQRDDLVDVVERDGEALLNVRALARLPELEHRAPGDHLAPVRQEAVEHLLEIQEARLAIDQRHHVHAEGVLQLRLLVQVVEHDVRQFAALQLDDDAHPGLVRLVAQVGNAVDLLLVDELGNLLDQALLVHLVGQLVDDDRLAVVATLDRLEVGAAAHQHATAAGAVALAHAGDAVDDARGREVRRRDDLDQLVDRHVRVGEQRQAGVDDFVQVVRRDVGRHADRDPRRTVDQEVRDLCRQDQRLLFRAIVVRPEVDRLLVDVGQQFVADPCHAHFRVTHRRGTVTIDRAEVALPLDQHVAQGKVLCHAHDRVIDRGIAVRVVLTDDVTDDARRLLVGLVPVVGKLVHRVEHTPMHRLQSVARVGQGTTDDDAHRVVEIRPAHLFFEADGKRFLGE